jgi:hypothetical protein
MDNKFPLYFTLDSGTNVTVADEGAGNYLFTLKPEDGTARQFTYADGAHTKAEWDELADFEQLEALRKFWLEMEDVE